MARRNRNFDAISLLKYSNKMKHVAKATGGSEGTSELYGYQYAIGQGGYIELRKRIKTFLDGQNVPGAIRPSFYALGQTVFRMLIRDGVPKSELANEVDNIVKRYFVEGTDAYEIAKKMMDDVFGLGTNNDKAKKNPAEIKAKEKKTPAEATA